MPGASTLPACNVDQGLGAVSKENDIHYLKHLGQHFGSLLDCHDLREPYPYKRRQALATVLCSFKNVQALDLKPDDAYDALMAGLSMTEPVKSDRNANDRKARLRAHRKKYGEDAIYHWHRTRWKCMYVRYFAKYKYLHSLGRVSIMPVGECFELRWRIADSLNIVPSVGSIVHATQVQAQAQGAIIVAQMKEEYEKRLRSIGLS